MRAENRIIGFKYPKNSYRTHTFAYVQQLEYIYFQSIYIVVRSTCPTSNLQHVFRDLDFHWVTTTLQKISPLFPQLERRDRNDRGLRRDSPCSELDDFIQEAPTRDRLHQKIKKVNGVFRSSASIRKHIPRCQSRPRRTRRRARAPCRHL